MLPDLKLLQNRENSGLVTIFKFYVISMITVSKVRSSTVVPCMRIWENNRSIQDCSSLSLNRLPALYPNTVSLILNNNNFANITDFPAQYAHLRELSISNTNLGVITKEALIKLILVTHLDLSKNQLYSIFLPPHRNLKSLILAYNHLSILPDFSMLSSLTILDLSYNNLLTVPPRLLPPNIQSLSISNNQIKHLTAWPFISNLQQLNISSNPFECKCALFQFIQWAESNSLVDSTQIPCTNSSTFRRSPEHGKTVCGPTITTTTPTTNIVSLSQSLRLCCLVSASPTPMLNWHLNGNNISRGISRQSPDIGTIEYCLTLSRIILNDLGKYSCVASLAGIVVAKEFLVERNKIPLVLDSTENIVFYVQFSITTFLMVCCLASCCLMRSRRKSQKKRNKRRATITSFTPRLSKQFTQFPQIDDNLQICCPHVPPCDEYCEMAFFARPPSKCSGHLRPTSSSRLSLHTLSPTAPSAAIRTRANSCIPSSQRTQYTDLDVPAPESQRHRNSCVVFDVPPSEASQRQRTNSVNLITSIVKRYSTIELENPDDFLEKPPSPIVYCRCHDNVVIGMLAQQTDL